MVTLKQYRKRQLERNLKVPRSRKDMNITYIPTEGRSIPNSKWRKALLLFPKEDFCWNENNWQHLNQYLQKKIFKNVLNISPLLLEDGTVQLQVIVEEAPPRSLEYGASKSLYTGAWEGEMEFEHSNLLGTGEILGFSFHRSPKDPEPSWSLYFNDDKLGVSNSGAYSCKIFTDYIGMKNQVFDREENQESKERLQRSLEEESQDEPFLRRGLAFQFPNWHSRVSATKFGIERVTTTKGRGEKIISTQSTLYPLLRNKYENDEPTLKQRIDIHLNTGARINEFISDNRSLKPYAATTFAAKHILPFTDRNLLAFEHVYAVSSKHLPMHESNAFSISAPIRGYSNPNHIKSYLKGTTELRIPTLFKLPKNKFSFDFKLIVFGDWIYYKQQEEASNKQWSIGIGFRKVLQGLPLKYDLSLTREGNIRNTFGLSHDFDL